MIFDLFKSGISENSRIRVNWAIKKKALQWCSWKYLFTSGKVDTYLKLPSQIFFEKKLPFSNCDIWYLISRIPKNNKFWVIWAIKRKALQWCSWKYLLTSGKVDTYIKLPSQIFLENVSFSNCDLWSLQKPHSPKQQNLSNLSHQEKSTSLVLLKIPFYIR